MRNKIRSLFALLVGTFVLVYGAFGLDLTRGPYLQMGSPTGAVVRWRTKEPSDSVVRYGTSVQSINQVAMEPAYTTEHEVHINSLSPSSRYFYTIGSSDQTLTPQSEDYFFHTSPINGSDSPTRIWVTGDSGLNGPAQDRVRDSYAPYNLSRHTNLWLMLGDNAYQSGTDAEYQAAIFEEYQSYLRNIMLWPTIGNHDAQSANSITQTGPYFDIFTLPKNAEVGGLASGTEAYYSFEYANIHFIGLDSYQSSRLPDGDMAKWLIADLAQNKRNWTIAFWHHPPYTKGSHNSDQERWSKEMRKYILPILEAGGTDLVLSGHSHAYERSFLIDGNYGLSHTFNGTFKKDPGSGRESDTGAYFKESGKAPHAGTVYLVAGSASRLDGSFGLNHPVMYSSLENLGSVILDIDRNRLDARFVTDFGIVGDSFSMIKKQKIQTTDSVAIDDVQLHGVGQVVGDFTLTQRKDGLTQKFIEIKKNFRVRGKKIKSWSLTKTWEFVVPSSERLAFFANAWKSREKSDFFIFQYSTDGTKFKDMFQIRHIKDDDSYQKFVFPTKVEGRVYIRVIDSNRTTDDTTSNSLVVDHMYFEGN